MWLQCNGNEWEAPTGADSNPASCFPLPLHFTKAASVLCGSAWMACISHTPTAKPAQLLIKSTLFCIIDLFPSRNGAHVTRIVSRLKRSWPTSAVNQKLPLTRGIYPATRERLSLCLSPSLALSPGPGSNHCLGFILSIFILATPSKPDPPSLSPPSEAGSWFLNRMMSGTALKHLTKWRGTVNPSVGSGWENGGHITHNHLVCVLRH